MNEEGRHGTEGDDIDDRWDVAASSDVETSIESGDDDEEDNAREAVFVGVMLGNAQSINAAASRYKTNTMKQKRGNKKSMNRQDKQFLNKTEKAHNSTSRS